MKQSIRQRLIAGLLIFTVLFSVVPSQVFAVTGSVRFDQGGGQIVNGKTFTLNVTGNVPSPNTWPFYGGGATIRVSYDASKLEVLGYNDSGGVFSSGSRNWTGTALGAVHYQSTVAFNASGVNNQKIIGIDFKVIGTGSTTVSFSSANVNNGPTSTTPSTFTLLAATCPAGQIGTPPNCTTPPPPAPPPSPTPRPSSTVRPTPSPSVSVAPLPPPTVEETPEPIVESDGGLKIEDVKITTNRQQSKVSWKLNRPEASPTIAYGTSKGALKSEPPVTKLEDGSYEAEFDSLQPGTLYHFSIKATTADNLQGAAYTGTLTTRGYPVQLTIQQNGVLAPGAKVTIGSRNFVANKNAIITTELGEGKMTAQITPVGSTESLPVTFTVAKKDIPASGNPTLQSFTLNAVWGGSGSAQGSAPTGLIIVGILAALAGTGGIIGFLLYKRRSNQDSAGDAIDNDLLIANYGTVIEAPRELTPTPNLDTAMSTIPPATDTTAVSGDPSPTYTDQALVDPTGSYLPQQPADTPAGDPYAAYPADMQPATTMTADFDPATLPLPPDSDVGTTGATEDVFEATTPDKQPMYYNDEAQGISPELAQIEAVEVPEVSSDEPSAIYDEATGELDIIHHNTNAATSQQVTTTTDPITPPENSVAPAEEIQQQQRLTPSQISPIATPQG